VELNDPALCFAFLGCDGLGTFGVQGHSQMIENDCLRTQHDGLLASAKELARQAFSSNQNST
jgi:hypothetical protein